MAIARHHRVIVVCPWPAGVALPEDKEKQKPKRTDDAGSRFPAPGLRLREAVRLITTSRFHQAYYNLRQTFGRLGVPVVCAASGDPARLILDRLEQLRSIGGRR